MAHLYTIIFSVKPLLESIEWFFVSWNVSQGQDAVDVLYMCILGRCTGRFALMYYYYIVTLGISVQCLSSEFLRTTLAYVSSFTSPSLLLSIFSVSLYLPSVRWQIFLYYITINLSIDLPLGIGLSVKTDAFSIISWVSFQSNLYFWI